MKSCLPVHTQPPIAITITSDRSCLQTATQNTQSTAKYEQYTVNVYSLLWCMSCR